MGWRNPETRKEYMKQYRLLHPDYGTRYYHVHADEVKEKRRQKRIEVRLSKELAKQTRKEHFKELRKMRDRESKCKYRTEHKEEYRAKQRAYYDKHKERKLAIQKASMLRHPDTQRRLSAKKRAIKKGAIIGPPINFQEIIIRDKGICQICHKKITEKDVSFDHIIPLSLGGSHC